MSYWQTVHTIRVMCNDQLSYLEGLEHSVFSDYRVKRNIISNNYPQCM